MKRILVALALLLAPVTGSPALAEAQRPPAETVPPSPGEQIFLPTVADGVRDTEQWNRVIGQIWVRNVSRPSLYRVAPKNGRANGRAVIVVPGGGYSFVSIESEGFWVAEHLAAQGYTAFVLKYRPRPTARPAADFARELFDQWEGISEENPEDFDYTPAVDDLAAAVALVSERSGEWGLAPDKLGVVGFSAGAQSVIRLLQRHEEAAVLDHVALIYPPIPEDRAMTLHPDVFVGIARDDFLFGRPTFDMVADWHAAGGEVEFHLYSGGSHGFGMRPQGTTSDRWMMQYLAWLDLR